MRAQRTSRGSVVAGNGSDLGNCANSRRMSARSEGRGSSGIGSRIGWSAASVADASSATPLWGAGLAAGSTRSLPSGDTPHAVERSAVAPSVSTKLVRKCLVFIGYPSARRDQTLEIVVGARRRRLLQTMWLETLLQPQKAVR